MTGEEGVKPMEREDLIKAYDEMTRAQEKFMQTKLDEDLIRAREAEHRFSDLARDVSRLPYPQNEAEEEREKKRKDEMMNERMRALAAMYPIRERCRKAKAKTRELSCRNHVKAQKAECQNQA